MKLLIVIIGILLVGCDSKETQPKIHNAKQEKIVNKANKEGVNKGNKEALQNGDIIFHTSRSNQSQAIQIATHSKYSHMGIIYKKGEDFFVYEAVQPIKLTKLNEWINRGKDKKYVVKRLKNSYEILTDEGIVKMKSEGDKYLGKDYDLGFEWSDDKIYCSELVWKIYKQAFNIEIGQLEKMGDFDLSDKAVQIKIKQRYGGKIPKDELVITPDRMFNSKNLMTVREK